jgi:hypothetical protein
MCSVTKRRKAVDRARALIAPIVAILLLLANQSVAEEKQRVTFPASAENTKYIQQHVIEVGDLPGHQIRVFELQRTFPREEAPLFGGLVLKEQWVRGLTDYTGNSGTGNMYSMYLLENGDKFFSYSSIVAHKAGSGLSAVTFGRIIGGTGKFATMQGEVRSLVTADPSAGINDGLTIVDYVLGNGTDAKREVPRPPAGRPGQR